MAVAVAGICRRREERLARMTAIAEAAQLALPPLRPKMTGDHHRRPLPLRDTRGLSRQTQSEGR
jgi:hypothetical protein